MPVDTSIYHTEPAPPFNPLQMIGQYQQVANAQQQNRLLQQDAQSNQMTLDAKNAIMAADRQSRNPDGTRNIARYNQLLSAGPGALLSTGENINNLQLGAPTSYNTKVNGVYQPQTVQAQQIGGVLAPNDVAYARAQQTIQQMSPQQIQAIQSQAPQIHAKVDGIISELTPIASNPNPTQKDIIDAAGNVVANGHVSAQEVAAHLSEVPSDPSQIQSWAQQKLQDAVSSKHLLNMISPQNDAPDPGQGGTSQSAPVQGKGQIQQSDLGEPVSPALSAADGSLQPTTASLQTPPVESSVAPMAGAPQANPAAPNAISPSDTSKLPPVENPPMGYEKNLTSNQDYYQGIVQDANSAKTENAALTNVLNLSKSGAKTGQILGAWDTWLAQHDINIGSAKTDAEKLQLIKDHAAQIATAGGGSRSDQDLFAKQLANVNEKDLPKVLQTMIPYLQGTRDMKIAQSQYLYNQDPNGSNPDKIAAARSFLQQHSDPRIWELARLQKSDPEAFKERLQSIDPKDAGELRASIAELRKQKLLGK